VVSKEFQKVAHELPALEPPQPAPAGRQSLNGGAVIKLSSAATGSFGSCQSFRDEHMLALDKQRAVEFC